MVSTILKTSVAEEISIAIMDAFVAMRNYISSELFEQKYIKDILLKHDNEIANNTYEILLLKESFIKCKIKN